MPGPPPTPVEVLAARGSWRAKLGGVSKRSPKVPKRPSWLPKSTRKLWRVLTKELEELGVIQTIDREALARYCVLWGRWREAEDIVAREGSIYSKVDDQGNTTLHMHPACKLASDLAGHLNRLEAVFGMTPSARARVHTQGKEEAPSGASAFMSRVRSG